MNRLTPPLDRRTFLASAALAAAVPAADGEAPPDDLNRPERPEVREPRATAFDLIEPRWDERLTLTVGTQKGDLVGADEKVIQAAVDSVARLGGGTVRLGPGTFRLRNAVYLASNVRLAGSGPDTVLIKEPSVKTRLRLDSDWYDQEITLADAAGFRVGDGVCLRAKNADNTGPVVIKRTLIARSGNRFKLDRALRDNLWTLREATAYTLFPILGGELVSGVVIENLALDGNRPNNENLDGNYAGCIFLQDCRDVAIRRVAARNFNGDGISWQICHDVTVEECHSHDHAGLGLHPGSGSQRPVIRNNKLQRNDIGLFFCWGVKYGLAEKNRIEDNRVGISIGHRDTDNLIAGNDVLRSGKVGILFRPEHGKAFAAHRNRLVGNRVTDSGGDDGVAIDVQGETEGVALIRNDLRETRGPAKRIGIRLGSQAGEIKLDDNRTGGFATPVADLRNR
jgi:nitrous oxidase accessory protein NosD